MRHPRSAIRFLGVAGSLVLTVLACTPFKADADPPTDVDAAVAPDTSTPTGIPIDAAADASGVNPYGIPYPTKHLGVQPRSGNVPGDVLPNFMLVGYPLGASTISSMQLADVYDPETKKYDLVVIFLVANLPVCERLMTQFVSPPSGMAFITVTGDAIMGMPATGQDLMDWRGKVPFPASVLLDPTFATFRPGLYQSLVPVIIALDARTMEIVFRQEGAGGGGTDPDKAMLETVRMQTKARIPTY